MVTASAITVQQIIADVQLAFDNANPMIVLDCVNRVHRDLCAEFPVYKDSVIIQTVAGQQEYALDRSVTQIRRAILYTDAATWRPLQSVDVLDLDAENQGWTKLSNGTPNGYYIDGGYVGLVPAPDTTAVAGYPMVTLDILECVELGIGDTLPASIRTRAVYVQGARRYYAEMEAKDQVGIFDAMYQREISDMERIMGRRNSQYHRKQSPSVNGYISQV